LKLKFQTIAEKKLKTLGGYFILPHPVFAVNAEYDEFT